MYLSRGGERWSSYLPGKRRWCLLTHILCSTGTWYTSSDSQRYSLPFTYSNVHDSKCSVLWGVSSIYLIFHYAFGAQVSLQTGTFLCAICCVVPRLWQTLSDTDNDPQRVLFHTRMSAQTGWRWRPPIQFLELLKGEVSAFVANSVCPLKWCDFFLVFIDYSKTELWWTAHSAVFCFELFCSSDVLVNN